MCWAQPQMSTSSPHLHWWSLAVSHTDTLLHTNIVNTRNVTSLCPAVLSMFHHPSSTVLAVLHNFLWRKTNWWTICKCRPPQHDLWAVLCYGLESNNLTGSSLRGLTIQTGGQPRYWLDGLYYQLYKHSQLRQKTVRTGSVSSQQVSLCLWCPDELSELHSSTQT